MRRPSDIPAAIRRTKLPFVHKYFAIGTAIWLGPERSGLAKQETGK
jgi:hypothetical protein